MKKVIGSFRFGEPTENNNEFKMVIGVDKINKCLNELENESDRSAVIVAASFIDEILSILIKNIFSKGDRRSRDGLFEFNGPFSNLKSKIEILYCLGEIHKNTRDDLDIIRKIRNECAHNWDTFKFDDSIYNKYLSKITTSFKSYDRDMTEFVDTDNLQPRNMFIVVCGIISFCLSFQRKNL